MNTKTLSVALLAVLAVFALSFTSAASVTSNAIDDFVVTVDGITIDHIGHNDLNLSAFAGETFPVRVYFTSNETLKDVEVEVELNGETDSDDSFFVGNVINDSRIYRTGVMNLEVPSTLDDLTDTLYLTVTISADDMAPYTQTYTIFAQRNAYELDVVSLDYDMSVSAGDIVPVSVVIKNRGYENSNDGFVVVAIPELGISAKGYLDDLVSIENCENGCDDDDAVQKVLNLKIPSSAKDGVYELIVKVYDDDSTTTVAGTIKVSASTLTQAIAATKGQDMKAGQTKTYELILVNSANTVAVYNLQAVSGSDLSVSVPSVVTVDAGSSKTVQVIVTASSDAEKGVYPFTVEANGQSIVFNANVTGAYTASLSAIVLTVILVIVFIALLVALILLLTRKDKPASEEVETSYY